MEKIFPAIAGFQMGRGSFFWSRTMTARGKRIAIMTLTAPIARSVPSAGKSRNFWNKLHNFP